MFVKNQVDDTGNHRDIIVEAIERSSEMIFMVAYIRDSGVDMLLDKIKGKPTKLLCSFDMNITQISGIKKLVDSDVEVKVYQSNRGTFHPKVWLFRKNVQWEMLIGSANLTQSAFIDNVEASILVEDKILIKDALKFFYQLWDSENSISLNAKIVDQLMGTVTERRAFQNTSIQKIAKKEDSEKVEILFKYIKSWVDIPKFDSRGISSLWRGWYIIPDQGYISDIYVQNLKSYLPFVLNGVRMKNTDHEYQKLLGQFVENSNFQREELKISMHSLFVRQAKNYLIKFGWCYHPIKQNGKLDKTLLCLSELGKQINQCQTFEDVKNLYSEYFMNYSFNGLKIVPFTKRLLERLGYLTLQEFNYFVKHAYTDDDLDIIINLVTIYRSLSTSRIFDDKFNEYFREVKEPTAQNVYGNYVKNTKHTISAIAWCNGFCREDNFTLKLVKASH